MHLPFLILLDDARVPVPPRGARPRGALPVEEAALELGQPQPLVPLGLGGRRRRGETGEVVLGWTRVAEEADLGAAKGGGGKGESGESVG